MICNQRASEYGSEVTSLMKASEQAAAGLVAAGGGEDGVAATGGGGEGSAATGGGGDDAGTVAAPMV